MLHYHHFQSHFIIIDIIHILKNILPLRRMLKIHYIKIHLIPYIHV